MPETSPVITLHRPAPNVLELRLSGPWIASAALPDTEAALAALEGATSPRTVRFDCRDLMAWDSLLLTFLLKLLARCDALGIESDRTGLPEGVKGMMKLAQAEIGRASCRERV